jgi:hypothetical protein
MNTWLNDIDAIDFIEIFLDNEQQVDPAPSAGWSRLISLAL